METYFASAERSSREEIQKDKRKIISLDFVVTLSEATNTLFMILNEHRQIIFANKKLLTPLQSGSETLIGQRPGEILNCINSMKMKAGCGTHPACKECGAANAILSALEGKSTENECRINSRLNNKYVAFDLSVKAHPFEFDDQRYVLFSVVDISDSKRREILERTFLHDVLNTAGGIYGFSGMLKEDLRTKDAESLENAEVIYELSDSLVHEIKNQQKLLAAERNELQIDLSEVALPDYLNAVIQLIEKNEDVKNRPIRISKCNRLVFQTDKVLLQRILINMIKNAAEASEQGQEVIVKTDVMDNKIRFSVHNSSHMQESVQLQVFQRSFSTKGSNRGIGTYSMKLFGENYLQGKVWFDSDKDRGTTFYLEIPLKVQST